MTWKPHYYADEIGRVRKISEMTKSQVSQAISRIYAEFKLRDFQLHALHERLWQFRKKNDPNVKLTNTRVKILQQFKVKENQENYLALAEENKRLRTIIAVSLQNLEEGNLLLISNLLSNAFKEEEKDD